jgi:hypothetical protein
VPDQGLRRHDSAPHTGGPIDVLLSELSTVDLLSLSDSISSMRSARSDLAGESGSPRS